MRKLLFVLAFFVSLQMVSALDHVVIAEVLYDPLGTESGGESVQIYNPLPVPVDISAWILATESSAADATIPPNTILMPHSYYLVADVGWSTGKDNVTWPIAGHEEAITLANTDAGVALMNGTIVIDAVGWGIAANINSGLFEGIPANHTAAGKSLKRQFDGVFLDINNNADDFYTATPSFSGQQTIPAGSVIALNVIIEGKAPVIDFVALADDDASQDGVQVFPVPKLNKSVVITIQVSDSDVADISLVSAELNRTGIPLNRTIINTTTAIFSGSVQMAFSAKPGNYTVLITAADASGLTSQAQAVFSYESLIGIELDDSSLTFYALAGKTADLVGDDDFSTANLTVQNIGNSVVDITLAGTDLTSASGTINASRIAYTFDGTNFNSPLSGAMTYSGESKDVNLDPGAFKGLSLRLGVPSQTMPGNYSGSISLIAVAS